MASRLSTGLIAVSVVACALFTAAMWAPSTAHAAGAVGNGGAPGGGGPDLILTDYGYGWYQFPVDSPVTPRNGAFTVPWSEINNTCKGLGAKSIIAYVVFRSSGGLANSVVFNYPGWPDSMPGAHGNDGFPWLTVGQAKAKYDSSDFNKTGYTWGVNVGWFCYDFGANWSINGQSYIEKGAVANKTRATKGPITASVGDTLNWYHDMRNNGPDAMEREVFHVIDKTGFTGGWSNNQPTGWGSGPSGNLFVRIYATEGDPYTRYTVTQNDVGKTLCQRIAWRDRAWNTPGAWGRANYVCANVPYSYQLTPSMTVNPSTVIEPGEDTMSIDAMMRNAGTTKSRQVSSMTTRIVIPKGTSLPSTVTTSTYSGGDITQAACAHFTVAGRKACDVQTRNVVGHVFPANSNTQFPGGQYDDDISGINLEVGDRLCYVASVNQYSATASAAMWRHSGVRCVEVAKSPKVQIKGGDLLVGRAQAGGAGAANAEVTTSITTKRIGAENRVFGSWMEYGIFAPGAVQSASGAALAGENGGDVSMQTEGARNKLTFQNRFAFGEFDDVGTMGNIREQFAAPASNCGGGALASRDGVYNCTNNMTVSGNIPVGKSVVIIAPRITINNDITYSSGQITSIADIPQLILIADTIVINSNVKQVDAWLIADLQQGSTGSIVTCPDGRGGTWMPSSYVTGTGSSRGLTTSVCADQLQVNGPTMANKLYLRRTAGSEAGLRSNEPAEIFNLRADAYLWSSQYGTRASQIFTTYTRDLAPRF